jgi:hypothetical protein
MAMFNLSKFDDQIITSMQEAGSGCQKYGVRGGCYLIHRYVEGNPLGVMRKTTDGDVSLQNKAIQSQDSKRVRGLSRCTECLYYSRLKDDSVASSYICKLHGMVLRSSIFNNGCTRGKIWRKA